MSRLPGALPVVFAILVATSALLSGCGHSVEGLAPARLALLPGSVGAQPDDVIAIANDRYPLRWTGEWVPLMPPGHYERFLTGANALGSWSEQDTKFTCVFTRTSGGYNVYVYFFDRALYQNWDGRYAHIPMRGRPLAVRLEGTSGHIIAGLYHGGNPDRMLRVAYDRIALMENVQASTTTGTVKVAAQVLPGDWPSRSDVVQAGFLPGGGLKAALAGAGQVVRWDPEQPETLEPCLTVAEVATHGVSADQVEQARLQLVVGLRDAPVYAAYFLPGQVLVWRLPAQGAAEYVGDAQTVGSGQVLRLAARPDGQGWAVVTGSAPSAGGTAAAPSAEGTAAISPVAGTLYLTDAKFEAPQALNLQGRSASHPAWSPTGNVLYFIVDGTELWKTESGQAPQQIALAPARMSLVARPGSR